MVEAQHPCDVRTIEAGRRSSYGHGSCPPTLAKSPEDSMSLLTWIIVGLVAGLLASLVMGGTGLGLIGDIIIGIIGAFVGGWIFSKLGTGVPFGGLGGTIFVAFIGAVVLLFILRLIRGTAVRRL